MSKSLKLFVLFSLVFVFSIFLTPKAHASGDGSTNNPFMITNCLDLQGIGTATGEYTDWTLDKSYKLSQNIDCSDTRNWNDNAGFVPIGSWSHRFTGVIDGNNKTITGLFIHRNIYASGLIGYMDTGSTVSNVGLIDVDIVSNDCNIGGLAGVNYGTVSNSYTTGVVRGSCQVGGLVGGNNASDTIIDSYSRADVYGTDYGVGGLVGVNGSEGHITDSYATGNVANTSYFTGGLVGENGGLIVGSYATGNVVGNHNIGGFVGTVDNGGNIYNSYSTGTATGSDSVGGFVGYNVGDIYFSYAIGSVELNDGRIGSFAGYNGHDSIYSSFSTGSVVSSGGWVGGFIGENDGYDYPNSGWYTGAGPVNAIGHDTTANAPIASITYNESNISAFKNKNHAIYTTVINKQGILYDHWDFNNVWGINSTDNNGFPFLKWQGFTSSNSTPTTHHHTTGSSQSRLSQAQIAQIFGLPTPPSPQAPAGEAPQVCSIISILKLHSIGPDVECLQKLLNITVDGKFGLLTKQAVINFQNAHGLKPDGIVGKDTKAELFK